MVAYSDDPSLLALLLSVAIIVLLLLQIIRGNCCEKGDYEKYINLNVEEKEGNKEKGDV